MVDVAGKYDVAVIGAGHAGIEAALASARLGCKTAVFTINMDAVGNCPCNPSIGGTAKGHLVRELDALGGEMGKAADETFLQMRMLNRGKGPAVHSLRAQIDRRAYAERMKHCLELQQNLELRQAEIIDLLKNDDGEWELTTRLKTKYTAKAVVIATGTYLGGVVFVGDVSYESGPDGIFPSKFLPDALKNMGMSIRRFKTGTPARVLKSSIDFTDLEEQAGDEPVTPFSYDTLEPGENKVLCHISWTNEKTKKIILDNLHRSPLYSGKIEGIGPRYCPSIEDKIVRFSEKERHQLFIEPCGLNTEEMYLQGMSSSLPEDVQTAFYHSIKGLENAVIMRPAYAIEYYCCDPLQLRRTLEFIDFENLYGAGQFNGSSGYEEAAVQGFVAGVNAALKILGREPMVLDRASSYIGTLIDDLVTKGVDEPYRMFTSRAEYRILLRQDDADMRLTEKAYKIGLAKQERYDLLTEKKEHRDAIINFAENYSVKSQYINEGLEKLGTTPLAHGCKLIDLILRPQLTLESVATLVPALRTELDKVPVSRKEEIIEAAEILIKYSGYIRREQIIAEKINRLENIHIKGKFDYNSIQSLSTEARQKLTKIDPDTIAQASRIPGISPSDINILLVLLGR